MIDDLKEEVSIVKNRIDICENTKEKILKLRQDSEEAHYNRTKLLEIYINSDSLSSKDRFIYSEKYQKEKIRFLQMNDDYENALIEVNREEDEYRDKLCNLTKELEKEKEQNEKTS